jgi:hypothetical protein
VSIAIVRSSGSVSARNGATSAAGSAARRGAHVGAREVGRCTQHLGEHRGLSEPTRGLGVRAEAREALERRRARRALVERDRDEGASCALVGERGEPRHEQRGFVIGDRVEHARQDCVAPLPRDLGGLLDRGAQLDARGARQARDQPCIGLLGAELREGHDDGDAPRAAQPRLEREQARRVLGSRASREREGDRHHGRQLFFGLERHEEGARDELVGAMRAEPARADLAALVALVVQRFDGACDVARAAEIGVCVGCDARRCEGQARDERGRSARPPRGGRPRHGATPKRRSKFSLVCASTASSLSPQSSAA